MYGMLTIRRTFLLAIAILMLLPEVVMSQDIHFSQFYASPLTLNPALTGKMNGDYRIAGIYRSQWKSITSNPSFVPFATPSASFDMPFVLGKKQNNAIGAGIVFTNDITNQKRFNTVSVLLSVAYHKPLGKKNAHQLSIGVQGGIRQLNIKYNEFLFGSQFDNATGTFDPTVLNGETFAEGTPIIPDFNVGLFYSGRIVKKLVVYGGFSYFHLGEPDQSVVKSGGQSTGTELPSRYVVHGGLAWSITKKIHFLPGVIYMAQAKAREINVGANFGFDLLDQQGKEVTLFAGCWYRVDDAVSPMIAVELLRRFRVGFSYDVTTSSLKTANGNKGGFEISLIYVGRILRAKQLNLFCPRF